MRINHNISAMIGTGALETHNKSLSRSLEKLSTGLRINRASDDAAGLAISENMRAQVKGTDAAVDVIANATNYINTADGYMQTANDMLNRMEELAVAYNDGTKSQSDLDNLQAEFDALNEELTTNIDAQAKFNGDAIFSDSDRVFQVGANEGEEFTVTATGTISDMVGSLDITDLDTIKDASTAVSTVRADLGAAQSQLNFKSSALQNYSENISAAEGRIRNADMAKESSTFAKNQILVQASTAMLAQANSTTQNVLSLLR
jgi:flagellin